MRDLDGAPVSETHRVYRGWLGYSSDGEEEDILTLASRKPPPVDEVAAHWRGEPRVDREDGDFFGFVSELIQDGIDQFGNYLSVRYYTADRELSLGELDAALLHALYGEGDATYRMRYSETTGYLWTEDDVQVGGHDLLRELSSYVGEFLHLEIVYSTEGKAGNG